MPAASAPSPANPIAAVIAQMEAIEAGLAPTDGVACFNALYLAVTRAVDSRVADEGFADPAFLRALDVAFAQLYFDAVDAVAAGRKPSRAWAPLFERRGDRRVAAIQFALAGMNAHINHDLPLALIATFEQLGLSPEPDGAPHADYQRVNGTLTTVEEQVKARFATGLVGVADHVLGRLDDVLAMWSIGEARNAAWQHCETLWALRDHRRLYADALDALDGICGLAGRGLLTPVLDA
ncbi:MAG TPA: DUF5995 family protein [Conexibacter sp.]